MHDGSQRARASIDRAAVPLRLLMLEDDAADAELILHELRRGGFDPAWVRVEDEAGYVAGLDGGPDVILADYNLAGFDATRALEIVRARDLDVPFIVVSGTISEELAVECMHRGAADYLLKDRLGRLGAAVRRALAEWEVRREKRRADAAVHALYETERAARAEAEAAIRARDEFLAVAAHELKTPMTSLQAAVQFLLRQDEPGAARDPQQLARTLRLIEEQTRKLGRLVSHLLETSRIDVGKMTLSPTVEDLAALVSALADQAQARARQHRLVVTAPPELRARVDAPGIERVVANLLDNAIKFSPDGGPIEVDLSAPDAETVLLTVRDHGIGVPVERRGSMFDRFHQAHGESYRSGLGLGLYVSRTIVELHGGTIRAEFPPDGGTRIVVRLPRVPASAPSDLKGGGTV